MKYIKQIKLHNRTSSVRLEDSKEVTFELQRTIADISYRKAYKLARYQRKTPS